MFKIISVSDFIHTLFNKDYSDSITMICSNNVAKSVADLLNAFEKKLEDKTINTTKTLNEIADEVHSLAWKQGWHHANESEDDFIQRACNNLHNEVSELNEAWRDNQLHELCDKAEKMKDAGIEPLTCIEEEFADIIIRALDNCRKLNVDIQSAIERKHAFNATRPYRHGGKKS